MSNRVREFHTAALNYVAVASATDMATPEVSRALDACTEAFKRITPADLSAFIAASVPTPEQRAAVGRLVDLAAAETAYYGDAPLSGFDHVAAVRSAKAAIQPGDIEAARAVANYPENPECLVAEGGGNG